MDILITESQQKLLITEGVGETLQKLYSGTIDYSADLYQRVLKRLGINFKILLTFSSMIGAIARPLEEFLRGKFPTLNEDEILLLLIGTISILYFENKEIKLIDKFPLKANYYYTFGHLMNDENYFVITANFDNKLFVYQVK